MRPLAIPLVQERHQAEVMLGNWIARISSNFEPVPLEIRKMIFKERFSTGNLLEKFCIISQDGLAFRLSLNWYLLSIFNISIG